MTPDIEQSFFRLAMKVERLKKKVSPELAKILDQIMAYTGNQIVSAAIEAFANDATQLTALQTQVTTLQAEAVDPAALQALAALPQVAAILNASSGAVTPATPSPTA